MDTTYTWSPGQIQAWYTQSKAPAKLRQLDRDTTLITLVLIPSSYRRRSDGDILITRPSFEYLEACPTVTVILTRIVAGYVLVIPRGAIAFDEAKKKGYREESFHSEDLPTLSSCLK